jgi:asparagine synthase (glutamine-hydrolysing)
MSTFAGICAYDGDDVDGESLAILTAALGGSEVCRLVSRGRIGMIYRDSYTTQEWRRESQPAVTDRGQIICWNGRLDNREDLLSVVRDELKQSPTDVAVILAAYNKWSFGCLPRIVGDFAFSLWDEASARLILARDVIGPRTLFYHEDLRRIVWSTDLSALLRVVRTPLEISEEYLADLVTRLPDPAQTPYKCIAAVPPGHVLVARDGRSKLVRYWEWDPAHQVRYRTDAEYEEHFRHLFREAVEVRLRVRGPVTAELSGGIDSSSIVCMANEILRCGDETVQLNTVSYITETGDDSAELRAIRAVEEKIGIAGEELFEADYNILGDFSDDLVRAFPNPVANTAEYYRGLNEFLERTGSRVVLSGKGGDTIAMSAAEAIPEFVDLLRGFKLLQLDRQIRRWSQSLNQSRLNLLWRKVIVPLFLRRSSAVFGGSEVFVKLYERDFVERTNLGSRLLGMPERSDVGSRAARYGWKLLQSLIRELSSGFYSPLCNAEISYPFTHRPLVEFMLAIPIEQKVRPGETRSVVRRALHGLVPNEVVNRKKKLINKSAVCRAVEREWSRFNQVLRSPLVCERGYVDRGGLKEILVRARNCESSALVVLTLIPIERWLRNFEKVRCDVDHIGFGRHASIDSGLAIAKSTKEFR